MNNILVYIFIFILLIILMNYLHIKSTERFNNINKRPPGPWGDIGTGQPWYKYPYILHNIEYY